ncbi:MAG: bacteriophage spanin2 family protein [Bergeyella sp.]
MQNYFKFFLLILCISLSSCKAIIANPGKPLKDDALKLNQWYEIQDYDAKIHNIKIMSVDDKSVAGISRKGDTISINKKQIREVKKVKIASSIVVGILAITPFIFSPN